MTTPMQAMVGASLLAAGTGGAVYYATYGVRSQWLGPAVWRGRTDVPSVALTFDDGPGPETEAILDALAARRVKGTFFMVGRQVERHPGITRRIVADGHEIGNHSYSHPLYLSRTSRQTLDELARTQDAIAGITGVRPIWSRPPYGVRTPAYFRAARALGLRTIQWTVAGFDWKPRTPERIARDVLRGAGPGAIVLLHVRRTIRSVCMPDPSQKPVVFLDFDGTISRVDVVDAILDRYADRDWLRVEQDWKAGRIGSRTCLAEQIALVRAARADMDGLLATIQIDPGFVPLLKACDAAGIRAHIVSDGFDYCIARILAQVPAQYQTLLEGV